MFKNLVLQFSHAFFTPHRRCDFRDDQTDFSDFLYSWFSAHKRKVGRREKKPAQINPTNVIHSTTLEITNLLLTLRFLELNYLTIAEEEMKGLNLRQKTSFIYPLFYHIL